ncbi:MAG TPA: hypothetical protein VES42_22075 [Pilimelia sp.]|nr:hypothetical protein [Pilimelia sp.]
MRGWWLMGAVRGWSVLGVAAAVLGVVAACGSPEGDPVVGADDPGAAVTAGAPGPSPTGAFSPPPGSPGAPGGAGGHNEWDASKLPDPCRTVTLAEVRSVLGAAVQAGTRVESWPPLCSFKISAGHFLYVSDDAGDTGRQDFTRQRSDSARTQPVEGIGADAYWSPDFRALHVLSGSVHLTVKFAGPNPPSDPQSKALAIARTALPRVTTR